MPPEPAEEWNSPEDSQNVPVVTLGTLPNTPAVRAERDALMAMLQHPQEAGAELLTQAVAVQFHTDPFVPIAASIATHIPTVTEPGWLDRVIMDVPMHLQSVTRELALAPLPQNNPKGLPTYVRAVVSALIERDLLLLKQEMMARLQRIADPQDAMFRQLQEQIKMLEQARRSLQTE